MNEQTPRRAVLIALAVFVVVSGVFFGSPAQAGPPPARLEVTTASPGRPGPPVAVAGDGQATVTVVPPTSGGLVTGYVVRVFEDNNNRCFTASATQLTCVVPDLVNGTAYTFESIATGPGDSSPWSAPSNRVTPRALTPTVPTPPGTSALAAPTDVSTVAKISSLRVSWSAVSGATGYTATTAPGGVSCETVVTGCVLAGSTATTVTVVAHSALGDSAASTPSAAVVPLVPVVPAVLPAFALPELSTGDGRIGLTTPGRPIVIQGTGFLPHSGVKVALYSTPVALGGSVADSDGGFAVRVVVPDDLPSGAHTLLAGGADPNGDARMITLPVTVVATEIGSHGEDGVTQTATVPVPADGQVTLLTGNDEPTSTVTVAGGTYTLTPATGVVRFTPTAWFSGIAPPARYRVTDALGTRVTGAYTAVVTTAGSRPQITLPSRIVSTVGASAHAPVTCAIARGAIARCVVTATATVEGAKTVVGYGVTTPALTRTRPKVTVNAVLNELGRYLAARPGGARMTFTADVIQRDLAGTRSASAATVVEAKRYRLGRAVRFGPDSSTVTDADYLTTANRKLQDGVRITCAGHADRREHAPRKLAVLRAKAACAVIAQGLGADVSTSGRVEKHPTGDDDTPAARARNRRVVVTVTN